MRFRNLLFGTAAVLSGCGGAAMAADLPIAEPAEYVRVCNAFGAGFFYIPNTDTCLKLGGYVRSEWHYVDGDTDVLLPGGTKSEFNNRTSRARANVMWEAKTSTDIGLIWTYIEFQATRGPADYDQVYPEAFEMPAAFIEVTTDRGIFTAGRTGSFFDFYGSDDYGTRIDVDDSTTEQNLFAYSVTSTLGLKGTLSIEDPDSSGRRLNGADDYEGQELPDLVGQLRLEREWGTVQASGVARHIHDVNGDGFGWAASGGFSVKLPIHDVGFSTQFGYADGAIAYLTNDPGGVGDFAGPDGDDTNQAWMARGGFLVPFTPTVTSWLDGSFTHAEDDTTGDDYDFWAVVLGGAWAPNDRLSMGPEVAYNNIDGDDAGEDGDVWGFMWRVEAGF
jgi:hypothetical protein